MQTSGESAHQHPRFRSVRSPGRRPTPARPARRTGRRRRDRCEIPPRLPRLTNRGSRTPGQNLQASPKAVQPTPTPGHPRDQPRMKPTSRKNAGALVCRESAGDEQRQMALRHQAWVAASQSCGPVSLHAGASTYKVSVWRAALYSPLRSARGRRGQGHCAESRSPVRVG